MVIEPREKNGIERNCRVINGACRQALDCEAVSKKLRSHVEHRRTCLILIVLLIFRALGVSKSKSKN